MSITTDVVIVGAGPVGLFQVFELGLQGLSAHVVDALPQAGGQCSELYPNKPIYDIPAIPICTGLELTNKLLEQIKPFNPVFHLEQTVDELTRHAADSYTLTTSTGTQFHCRAVIIAAGAGSFTPVKIRVEGISKFENLQVFYRVKDPLQHAGKNIVLLGGGDSALDWAMTLADSAKSLTIVNRTEKFRAAQASVDKIMAMAEAGKIQVLFGAAAAFREVAGKLTELQVTLRDENKTQQWLALDDLLVFFGLSPKLGAVEHWGLELERKQVTVNLETFETSTPGIYAIGDINTYPGKKKLILSGFHEAALSAYAIKQSFDPDKKINVQYTTTSPLMHERLGVENL